MTASDDSRARIVVTGTSIISAAGIGTRVAAKSIAAGRRHFVFRDGIVMAEITDFDAKQFVRPRKALKVMCREIQTAYAASVDAAADAGIEMGQSLPAGVDPHRIATVFGSEMLYHPADLAEAMRIAIADGQADGRHVDVAGFGGEGLKKITPLWLLKHLPNMATCHVGISLGALGPNNTLVGGDTSGPSALAEAFSYFHRGIADVAIVAAAGTRINETRLVYSCDVPRADSSVPLATIGTPGSDQSSGVVCGEGAAAMVIETLALATQRCARPMAEVIAVAQRFVPSPIMNSPLRSSDLAGVRGSRDSMRLAIEAALASLPSPVAIDVVVTHLSGDRVLDGLETGVIDSIASITDAKRFMPIHSIGQTGRRRA